MFRFCFPGGPRGRRVLGALAGGGGASERWASRLVSLVRWEGQAGRALLVISESGPRRVN